MTEKIGGHGVVGVLENGPGPTVLLRADMDALPVPELTGLEYASKKKGIDPDGKEVSIMHACEFEVVCNPWWGVTVTNTQTRRP